MTTKKAPKTKRAKQRRIAGSESPELEILRGEAELYANLVRSRMDEQQRENVKREEVVKAMKATGISVVTLDDGRKVRLTHIEATDKLKIESDGKVVD